MADTIERERLDGVRLAVVGRGRLGAALVRGLRARGLDVSGPLGRGADGRDADIVVLAVPDDAIAEAARVIRPGPLVGHCSGATTLASLEPHERFSMHPLLAVTGPEVAFSGAACAIAGSSGRALGVAAALADSLGMAPVVVPEERRDVYHAAASVAANYLVTLEGAAERLAREAGITREQLAPLVRASVENWIRLGAPSALTGPIARGDAGTVSRQRAAVERTAPDLLPLWDALADATRRLASTRVHP